MNNTLPRPDQSLRGANSLQQAQPTFPDAANRSARPNGGESEGSGFDREDAPSHIDDTDEFGVEE